METYGIVGKFIFLNSCSFLDFCFANDSTFFISVKWGHLYSFDFLVTLFELSMRLNLWTATEEELKELKSVGKKSADALIELRARLHRDDRNFTCEECAQVTSKISIDEWERWFDEGLICFDKPESVAARRGPLLSVEERLTLQNSEIIDLRRNVADIKGNMAEMNERFDRRFDEMNERVDRRFDEMNERSDRRFDQIMEMFKRSMEVRGQKPGEMNYETTSSMYRDNSYKSSHVESKRIPMSRTSVSARPVVMENILDKGYNKVDDGVYCPVKREKEAQSSGASLGGNRQGHRSRSPAVPKMPTFSGHVSSISWHNFREKFERTANHYQWSDDKKLDRLFDCLSETALEYANRSEDRDNYRHLVGDLGVRFDLRDTAVAARQKLHVLKQNDDETEEIFLQRVLSLASDGYGFTGNKTTQQIATESFLRSLKHKDIAL